MTKKLSSLDDSYTTGSLSNFPNGVDTKRELYEAKNNAEAKLRSSLPYNGKIIIVDDASSFPDQGILAIGPEFNSEHTELIYYASRTNDTFKELSRGFANSRQNQWPAGSLVSAAVFAEHHNSVKDALLNIQNKVGAKENPAEGSIHDRIRKLEARFLAPKAAFRAYPKSGPSGLTVRFQSFCEGDVVRYLWDLGDGTQTTEKSPSHTYLSEGVYTVSLNIITSSGAQGVYTKTDYIKISNEEINSFFYYKLKVNPFPNETLPLSNATAIQTGKMPGTFRFIDQTEGDVKKRYWIFGDGSVDVVDDDPNKHETTHVYENPGEYKVSLLVTFANEQVKRVFLSESVVVL